MLKISIILSFAIFTASIFSQVVQTFKGDRFTHYEVDDWISYAPALNINATEKIITSATTNAFLIVTSFVK